MRLRATGRAVLLCGALVLCGSGSGAAAGTSRLAYIELVEGPVTVRLRADGTCTSSRGTGSPGVRHEQVWERLTAEVQVTGLQQADIRAEIRAQIRATGTVVAEDGATVTTLVLGFGDAARRIDVHGLALLRRTYPDAARLARFDAARAALQGIAGACSR